MRRRFPCFGFLLPAVFLGACGREPPLPVYGNVPQFRLTDQLGRGFTRSALDGHVWVADFIFTHCPGPCPRMSSHMHAIQKATDASVRLVSFTVDPDRDTPPVLEEYGRKFGADDARWSFLTGDVATLNMLDRDAFHLGSIGPGFDHSTRLVLIDKKGRIRGYYGSLDDNPVGRVARDAARLEKENDAARLEKEQA